ncbi:helix-turn-helix transcriptional regulator [Streptomyces yangpuensis]|uniref:helix-turn-helix transcriptional regulator n=1 Tax=Streptomyces yangpuensis TaxID=1648182 RepID=UPI0038075284
MQIEKVIGGNMRRIREQRGLSQTDLGTAVGQHIGRSWSRQAVSAAEQGRRSFTASDLLALSLTLDVSVPELFFLADWRSEGRVQLGEGAEIGADAYRERILHELDAANSAQLMVKADVQELGAAVIKMREQHAKAGAALAGLEAGLVYAAKVAQLMSDAEAAALTSEIERLDGDGQ